jgi:putative membrane protein
MTSSAYDPWHHDGAPGWWPVFPIGFAVFWLLMLSGAYLLWRRNRPRHGAEAVLAERYARGEIDEEEYRERLSVLRP